MTGRRSVTLQRAFPCPAEGLWRALTQPHRIAEWPMPGDRRAEVGHDFRLTGSWGGVPDCRVLEADPPRRLSPTSDFAHADPAYDLRSIVTVTRSGTATGTHPVVAQSGLAPAQKQAFPGAGAGRAGHLEALARLVVALS